MVYPVKSRASEPPTMSTRTPSRSSAATGSLARRRNEGHGQLRVVRVSTHPRPRAGPRRVGQGRPTRERGAQGRCERPVLLAQALSVTLHGDVAQEPAGQPRLVRLPLHGQSDARRMGLDCKGDAQYPDVGRDLAQLAIDAVSRVIQTVALLIYPQSINSLSAT